MAQRRTYTAQQEREYNTKVAQSAGETVITSYSIHYTKLYDNEKEDKRLGKKHTYSVKIAEPKAAEQLLNDAGVLLKDEDGYTMETGLPKDMLKLTCCQKSYLKGAFQGSGSVSDPKKEYRLEFASRDADTDSHIQKILHSMDIPFHTSVRREWVITYIS